MKTIKSYCEEVYGFRINWREVILEAKDKGITDHEFKGVQSRAGSWATDPVACLELNIPRFTERLNGRDEELIVNFETGGIPRDEGLVDMAIMFLGHLERREFEDCLHVLHEIEKYASAKYTD